MIVPLPLPLNVELTDADLRDGRRTSTENCPVALAIKRALTAAGIEGHVSVGTGMASIYKIDYPAAAYLPKEIAAFIKWYDGSTTFPVPVELPYAFTLTFS